MNTPAPTVSVIVPTYQAEAYLHRCVDSILAQTLTCFECILVNDGSTDASPAICDDYARRDARVRVIHKENGGLSSARIAGLAAAQGTFIANVDADDWIEPTMFESLVAAAEREEADVVFSDYIHDRANRTNIVCGKPTSLDSDTVLSEVARHIITGSVCTKIYRRDFLNAHSISPHPHLRMMEDYYFTIRVLLAAPRIAYVPKAFYHYDRTCNPLSITHNLNKKNLLCTCEMIEELAPPLKEKGLYKALYRMCCQVVICFLQGSDTHSELDRVCFPEIIGYAKQYGIVRYEQFFAVLVAQRRFRLARALWPVRCLVKAALAYRKHHAK